MSNTIPPDKLIVYLGYNFHRNKKINALHEVNKNVLNMVYINFNVFINYNILLNIVYYTFQNYLIDY